MKTQMNAPKVANFFRGELAKKSTRDHRAKTRPQRGLEKQSAIVYPAQVSYKRFFFSLRLFSDQTSSYLEIGQSQSAQRSAEVLGFGEKHARARKKTIP